MSPPSAQHPAVPRSGPAGYDEEARYFERGVSEAKREELVEALDVSGCVCLLRRATML